MYKELFLAGVLLASSQKHDSILLQPLGPVEQEALQRCEQALEEVYGYDVEIAPSKTLPESAYYVPRQRYLSPKLIEFLDMLPKKTTYTIGITEKDISVNKPQGNWGMMGQAEFDGDVAIVSTYRLHGDWLEKVTVHEMGHMLGYEHCETPMCNMRDIKGDGSRLDAMVLGEFCDEHKK